MTLTSVLVGGAAAVAAVAPVASPTAQATSAAETAAPAAPTASSDGLVQMTITVTATGLGHRDLAFLRAIQWSGPRRALVTGVQLAPSGGGAASGIDGPCTLSLTLTIFSAPLSPASKAALEKLLSGK